MKKVVKILKCSNDIMWYKDFIGECYAFLFIDEYDKKIVVDLANSAGERGSIIQEDAEIFEVADDAEIREFNFIPTEIDLLNEKLDEKDEEILLLKIAIAELSESKDDEILNLKLAIAELAEGVIL